jgi:hypothetical protein
VSDADADADDIDAVVGESVAAGEVDAVDEVELELWLRDTTNTAKRITPTTTVNTTLDDDFWALLEVVLEAGAATDFGATALEIVVAFDELLEGTGGITMRVAAFEGAFLAIAFFATAFLATFLAGALFATFFATAFLATAFLAGALFAEDFLATAFFAAAFLAGALFAEDFLTTAFFATFFFVAVFLTATVSP